MPEQCPNCQSVRIGKKNYGKKAAGVVGASAGTYGGYVSAAAGGLLGGATGASAGVILGEVLDERVFDNYRCLDCGYSFSTDPDSRDDSR